MTEAIHLVKAEQIKTAVDLDKVEDDTLAVFCFSDQRPLQGVPALLDWRLAGRISRRLKSGLFVGEAADHLLLWDPRYQNGRKIFLFGLGNIGTCKAKTIKDSCAKAIKVMRDAGISNIVFLAPKLYGESKLEDDFLKAVKKHFKEDIKAVLFQGKTDE